MVYRLFHYFFYEECIGGIGGFFAAGLPTVFFVEWIGGFDAGG